jgi:hypothetical protein
MNNQEIRALSRYSQNLGALAGFGVPGAQEQKAAYEEILKLVKADPFDIIEPPLFSSLQSMSFSPDLKKLLASARNAFSNRTTKRELADALEEFIQAVSSEEAQLLPEAGILLTTAKRWRGSLPQESDEALLILERRVSLNLEQLEEDLSGGESARVDLPLSIVNRGIATAVSVFINVQIRNEQDEEDQQVAVRVDRAEQISPGDGRWRLRIDERIRRNESLNKTVTILYQGHMKAKIWLQYASSHRPSLELPSEALDFYLAPNSPLSETDNSGEPYEESNTTGRANSQAPGSYNAERSSNPYIPDLPLLKPAQWDHLVKGSHPQLLSQVANDPELSNGRILVIRGCRRSGKTTFLRRLETELSSDQSTFLPVYVDVRVWFQELGKITDQALFYEFASEIQEKAVELLMRQNFEPNDIVRKLREARELLTRTEENKDDSMTLNSEEFSMFAAAIEQALGRKIILIIDELDWWIQRSVFKGNVASILNVLAASSLIEKPFSALISHDLTSTGWGVKSDRTLLPRYITFLERDDIEALAQEAPSGVGFSWCAIDFIWRVSGGWPALAQLVFYVAFEELRRQARGQIIDISITKKSIDIILREHRNLLSYLFGTLTSKEFALLKTISKLVDLDSGEFQYLRFNSVLGYRIENPGMFNEVDFDSAKFSRLMDSLKEKEIIAAAGSKSSKLRLRVGLFAYARSYNIDPEWH